MVVSHSQAHTSRHLTPGAKLGKYELIRQIAIGGMAELYLARTVGLEGFEKLVVVKRILPQFAETPGFVQMFLDEARLAATLHHPNIAQVYDIGVEEGSYFFTMEYVHGEDLRRIIASSTDQGVPVSLDAALTLAVGVAAGLHYAHQKAAPDGAPLGIVHRDVSPSNILVSYEGGVKVVDFGIARATSRQSSTLSGGLKGKITYMSPEQCRGGVALDRRSDIFSIGTLLYELSTGGLPFHDETEYGVLNQIVNNDVEPPTRRVPAYPPALEAIVLRAMARDPAQRYSTALELQRDLEDFAHDNRLRISPLTLGRLMETMFPAALAEWENARSQGAYFVEEHVVKTLVGKTTEYQGDLPVPLDDDSLTHKGPAPVAAPADDDRTDVIIPLPPPPAAGLSGPATMPVMRPPKAVPIVVLPPPADEATARITTLPAGKGVWRQTPQPGVLAPVTPPAPPVAAAPTPAVAPRAVTPPPVALPAEPFVGFDDGPKTTPGPGLVGPRAASIPGTPRAINAAAEATARVSVTGPDVTARVVLPSYASTESVEVLGRSPRKSRTVLIVFGLIAAASVVAALTVMLQKDEPVAPAVVTDPALPAAPSEAAPVAVDPPAPVAVDPPAPTPPPTPPPEVAPAPPVAVDPPVTAEPAVAAEPPAKVAKHGKKERGKTRRSEHRTRKPDPIKKAEPAKPAEPPAKKPDPPKEKPWTSDSPFMPVRTDK